MNLNIYTNQNNAVKVLHILRTSEHDNMTTKYLIWWIISSYNIQTHRIGSLHQKMKIDYNEDRDRLSQIIYEWRVQTEEDKLI